MNSAKILIISVLIYAFGGDASCSHAEDQFPRYEVSRSLTWNIGRFRSAGAQKADLCTLISTLPRGYLARFRDRDINAMVKFLDDPDLAIVDCFAEVIGETRRSTKQVLHALSEALKRAETYSKAHPIELNGKHYGLQRPKYGDNICMALWVLTNKREYIRCGDLGPYYKKID